LSIMTHISHTISSDSHKNREFKHRHIVIQGLDTEMMEHIS